MVQRMPLDQHSDDGIGTTRRTTKCHLALLKRVSLLAKVDNTDFNIIKFFLS